VGRILTNKATHHKNVFPLFDKPGIAITGQCAAPDNFARNKAHVMSMRQDTWLSNQLTYLNNTLRLGYKNQSVSAV
jgi:hypothetical protein